MTSETFIALGRSCLLANTRITESRSSSSWSWKRNKELEHAWSYSVAHMLTHTHTHSLAHTHTNTLLTILSSSAFASPTRSRSLLSTTNISPWNHNRESEGGKEEEREGGRVVVMCDLNYTVFQAVPECFGSNVSTVVLSYPVHRRPKLWNWCSYTRLSQHWNLHSSRKISHNVCLCVVLQCVCGHMLKCLCIC